MATVVFVLDSALDSGWRDYGLDPSQVTFCWQALAPRVEPGLACQERWSEAIIYGVGPPRETKLVTWSDDEAPPVTQGFYVAGRLYTGGKVQWIMRQSDYPVESESSRKEDHSVTIWDEPQATIPFPGLKAAAGVFTNESKKGKSIAGYARQHWRVIQSPRPVGCTLKEVEFSMKSYEIGAPPSTYALRTLAKPGTYDLPGELAGAAYTSSLGSDLSQYSAHLLMRSGGGGGGKGGGQGGDKKTPEGGTSGGGGGAAIVVGAAAAWWLLR